VSRYRIPDRVLRAPLEDQEVLLNTDTGGYHLLNDMGRAIIAALEAGADVDDIVRREAAETGEPEERVRADVLTFLDALRERGLLEPGA
jgi:hypothetical protein